MVIQMNFHHNTQDEGVIIQTTIENGKALLEFDFPFAGREPEGTAEKTVRIEIFDMAGQMVFDCVYPMDAEEPAKGLLLHPQLWRGMRCPYRYLLKAYLFQNNCEIVDILEKYFVLRTARYVQEKGWFLNDEPFEVRAVEYHDFIEREEVLRQNLTILKRMGAKTISSRVEEIPLKLRELCDEMGFWWCFHKIPNGEARENQEAKENQDAKKSECTMQEVAWESLLAREGLFLTDIYYYYRAIWSKEPFVYLAKDSIRKQKNKTLSVTAYSNLKKVALYVDGILFSFHAGEGECIFEDIAVETYPLMLTVWAGECGMSVTIYEQMPEIAH